MLRCLIVSCAALSHCKLCCCVRLDWVGLGCAWLGCGESSRVCTNLQGQLSVIKPEEKLELARLKASLSDRLTPTRDTNGFRKLLVLLTRTGKPWSSWQDKVLWAG